MAAGFACSGNPKAARGIRGWPKWALEGVPEASVLEFADYADPLCPELIHNGGSANKVALRRVVLLQSAKRRRLVPIPLLSLCCLFRHWRGGNRKVDGPLESQLQVHSHATLANHQIPEFYLRS
jgi:hypothetical protein